VSYFNSCDEKIGKNPFLRKLTPFDVGFFYLVCEAIGTAATPGYCASLG
jgi:hypothetical protein